MAKKFKTFGKEYKPKVQEVQQTTIREACRKLYQKHIIIKLVKTSDKGKIFNAARGYIMYSEQKMTVRIKQVRYSKETFWKY